MPTHHGGDIDSASGSESLQEVPRRVPPDSPLAPEWYRLEGKTSDKNKGELMLAVWHGTQADEAFPDAWLSDAISSSGTSATGATFKDVPMTMTRSARPRS